MQTHCESIFKFIFYSKQLIPEFFQSSGEFLLNSQNLPLGCKQDKTKVMDVEIPPWAKGAVCIVTFHFCAQEFPCKGSLSEIFFKK